MDATCPAKQTAKEEAALPGDFVFCFASRLPCFNRRNFNVLGKFHASLTAAQIRGQKMSNLVELNLGSMGEGRNDRNGRGKGEIRYRCLFLQAG